MSRDDEILRRMKLRALKSESEGKMEKAQTHWNLFFKFLGIVQDSKERRARECQEHQEVQKSQ